MMAIEAGLPVVPVAIDGSRFVMRKGRLMTCPGDVRVTVLDPIPTAGLKPEQARAVRAAGAGRRAERPAARGCGAGGRGRRERGGVGVTLDVAPALQAIVAPACLAFDGVTVVDHDHRLDPVFAEAESKLRAAGVGLDDAVQRTRALYRGIGLDPTKTRPSSESLLRRVRRGEPLPRVNTIVDLCNWCSVETPDRLRRLRPGLPRGRGADAAARGRRRGLRRDPQGSRQRRRPAHARRCRRPVRQPDLGLAADLGVGRDHPRPVRAVRPGGDRPRGSRARRRADRRAGRGLRRRA